MIRANQTCIVTLSNGVIVNLRDGDRYDDDDPAVREFPSLFGDVVEEATARPGERRSVRRNP